MKNSLYTYQYAISCGDASLVVTKIALGTKSNRLSSACSPQTPLPFSFHQVLDQGFPVRPLCRFCCSYSQPHYPCVLRKTQLCPPYSYLEVPPNRTCGTSLGEANIPTDYRRTHHTNNTWMASRCCVLLDGEPTTFLMRIFHYISSIRLSCPHYNCHALGWFDARLTQHRVWTIRLIRVSLQLGHHILHLQNDRFLQVW